MAKTKHVTAPQTASEEHYRTLVVEFLAELLQNTCEPDQPERFHATLQAYCDSFRPCLEPDAGPLHPRSVFSLLEEYTMDAAGENVTVIFSPEGEALFRAWVRRNESWSTAGLHPMPAWSH